jgi:hypothetical protein
VPVLEQLWGSVMGTAASSGKLMRSGLMQGSHAKICNLDLEVRSDEYILGFQVTVAHVERVAV